MGIKYWQGFTLIELIIVIVLLGVLTLVAAPRFVDLSRDAKIASLQSIASQMRATNSLVQNVARARGLRPTTVNPSGGNNTSQTPFIVDFGFGTTEVTFFTLCPESQAEDADALNYFDFMQISDSDNLFTLIQSQFASIGYDIPVQGAPTQQGCYVYYDNQDPNCLVAVVTVDC